MSRNIFFDELATELQNRILDSYGAETAAELGLDKNPYAEILYDAEGRPVQVKTYRLAV